MQSEKNSKRNILYFLLALLVAAGLWYYVDETGNSGGPYTIERTITNIPITYTDVDTVLADRGLMLLDEGTTATIDMTVVGGRRDVNEMDVSDIRVTVNLSSVVRAGTQTVGYSYSFGNYQGSVSLKKASISIATVNISELYSKEIEIKCDVNGSLAEDYSAGEPRLSTTMLEIRGKAEDIDPVSYAKVTLDIGEDAMETVSETLTWQYYDENDQLLDASGIHPTVESVEVTLPVYVKKELDLVVNFKESPGASVKNLKFDIQPSTIVVSGDATQLKNVDKISLGDFDLLDLVRSGTRGHTYAIIIPDGCQNLSGVTRATLEVEFVDLTSAQVTASQFEVNNIPAGKSVNVLTEELTVSIFGTTADVEAVKSEDVTIAADLSDYAGASGTYTVPAEVRIDTSGDVGVSGTYQVQVTIQAQEEPEE